MRRELAGDRDDPSLDLGIGGAGRHGSLKCLHAHVAFALARPGYELGERILAELEPLWPPTAAARERRLESTPWRCGAGAPRVGGGATAGSRPSARTRRATAPAQRRSRAIADELRRRIGRVFTLEELAAEYGRAERLGHAARSPSCRRRRTGRRGLSRRDRRRLPPLRARRARLRALSSAPHRHRGAAGAAAAEAARAACALWIAALVLVVVFAAGLALGQALHDNPLAGGTQTLVRTLKPLRGSAGARDRDGDRRRR